MYHSGDGASVYDIQIDAAEVSGSDGVASSTIVFPDKDLLFTADFRRLGGDLILAGHDKQAAIVYGYFNDNRRASLTTLEGAELTGAVIEALAGPDQPGQYAQATLAAATQKSIGRVEKVSGSATVLRNGVPVELHLGDHVAKGDVVQTSSDSSLTIKFSDGTVFGLSSSARIILNEMVYTADSHTNSALFTLVQGVIGFVAGRIAKTGDLKVETPVATMAIRGTAVKAEISSLSGTTRLSLLTEPDGTVGSFLLFDKRNSSRVITSISDPGIATIIAPTLLSDLQVTQVSKTPGDIRSESDFVRDLFQTFSPEPRQRRGGSDFDGGLVVPVNAHPSLDNPDQTPFAITPYFPKPAVFPASVFLLPEERLPVVLRGSATEDGPLIRLDASAEASVKMHGIALPVVNVPDSLPPGVAFLESSGTFTLNPSHPVYQSLAAGEIFTVTVNYSLSGAGTRIPASVSWTITGRNDAPIAGSDRFTGLAESGQSVLAIRANDFDIDRDPLRIIDWTNPIEGSVFRNSSGGLVFDPGRAFQALSAGETATVSFTYKISDNKGGTDTATATVQIRGAGTFSSPHATAEASGILAFNQQPVSLAIEVPSQTTTTTTDLTIRVGLGPVLQPQMNILYAVDISGSTSEVFAGTPVGDLNGDGIANTILDAEIGGLIRLTERLHELGFSPADVTVTVIPFNASANPADEMSPEQNVNNTASVTFNLGGSEDEPIANFLRSLNAGGETNFEDALQAAIEKLQALDQGGEENLIYFLSDGNGTGAFQDELQVLNSSYFAKITAVGIGEDANLSTLDEIDNTGGAEIVTSTDELDASILGLPLQSGEVIDVDLFINGREILEVGTEDLFMTPTGFTLNLPIAGLARNVGDANTIWASITFTGGQTLTAELDITGALPLSADFIL